MTKKYRKGRTTIEPNATGKVAAESFGLKGGTEEFLMSAMPAGSPIRYTPLTFTIPSGRRRSESSTEPPVFLIRFDSDQNEEVMIRLKNSWSRMGIPEGSSYVVDCRGC